MAMTLTAGLRQALEDRYGCPVIDLYSTNESGRNGVQRLRRWPKSETSDSIFCNLTCTSRYWTKQASHAHPEGEARLSGGFNPFLPLIRYRTGDQASLIFRADQPILARLEGRPPVLSRAADGRPINNVDVSSALRPLPMAQFNLHQAADGSLRLRLTLEALTAEDKTIQYTSDLE